MRFNLPPLVRIVLLLFGLVVLFSATAGAQGTYDTAPRFGMNSIFGSVKSMGMGGVQMGTGADGAAQAINPASPGLLRKSDFQFGLMPFLNSTTNEFNGSTVTADKSGFPLGNISLALATIKDETEEGDFRGGVFTVSYNRVSYQDRKSNWEGESKLFKSPGVRSFNSILDVYLVNSNQPGYFASDLISSNPQDQLIFNDNFKNDLVMGYDAYLLDIDSATGRFDSKFPLSDLKKTGYYQQNLKQGIWNFGYSINLNNNLFLGASFGHVRSKYISEVQYGEEIVNVYPNPSDPDFFYLQGFKGVNFQIYKNLEQTMRGVNGNVGVIYKVSDQFRLSAAIQLPSLTWISEKYSPRITANYSNLEYWADRNLLLGSYDVNWFENEFSYKLRLPARYRAGFNWFAGKQGTIGLDLEYSDFSKARLTEGDGGYNFVKENTIIANSYGPSVTVKTGGELRYNELRFRAGFAYISSPLKSTAPDKANVNDDTFYYTAGMGARLEGWYWDVALVLGYSKTSYNFTPQIPEPVNSKISSSQLRIGFGFYL